MNELELQIQREIAQTTDGDLFPEISTAAFTGKLEKYIHDLIQNDFQKLVSILYKVDVNEKKLKELLQKDENKKSEKIIAKLIIDRQMQKIITRRQFSKPNNCSEEKW